MRRLAKLWRNEKAATAVEYGLIISCVVLAMLGALQFLAVSVIEMWNFVAVEVLGAGG